MKKTLTFKITLCAILAAMAIVLALFPIPFFNIELTLYGIPLIIVGVIYGPGYGALCGFITGTTEQLVRFGPSVESLFYVLAPIAWGLVSALLKKLFDKIIKTDDYKINVLNIVKYSITITLTAIIANFLNTIALTFTQYVWVSQDCDFLLTYFFANVFTRLVSVPVHILFYIPICVIVVTALKKYLNEKNNNR